jgi:malonyl-CoA decarboxylase
MANAFFSDLLSTSSERGRTLLRRAKPSDDGKEDAFSLIELCEALLSGRGEASGTAMAREVLDRYHDLDVAERQTFFEALARNFGPDREKVAKAIEAWRAEPGDGNGGLLHFASEPRRQELIRRLNRAPGGTGELVAMRADLLTLMDGHMDLASLDRDIAHLLGSWFNRGFLVLRRIDWSTPANILEQIIRYEAVHEIHDWDDLRRRIDPVDRRCYAFFHPAMADAPLIFVEVALTETVPSAIAPLLAVERKPVAIERARTAVFYSISNTQRGLGGISFGSFLIKQVVEELRRELPKLDTFVTLSPVPGFMVWLKQVKELPLSEDERELLGHLDEPSWF